jgi:hypothetical protein
MASSTKNENEDNATAEYHKKYLDSLFFNTPNKISISPNSRAQSKLNANYSNTYSYDYDHEYLIHPERVNWIGDKKMDEELAPLALAKGKSSPEYNLAKAEMLVERKRFAEASTCYEKAKEPEKAKECKLKQAELCFDREYYEGMVIWYMEAGISLSEISKDMQKKVLDLIRQGNIEATQGLASLVENEEDEVMFNEARAGMVL